MSLTVASAFCSNMEKLSVKNDDDAVHANLSEIFKYLPLGDRKYARLVSRQWNKVSREDEFVDKEVFLIPRYYPLKCVTKFFEMCQNKTLHLRFVRNVLGKDWNVLWEKFGHRIVYLMFYKCQLDVSVFSKIFTHCSNLKVFLDEKNYFFGDMDDVENTSSKYISQSSNHLVCQNLKILRCLGHGVCRVMEKSEISRVASLFPNLKQLHLALLQNGRGQLTEDSAVLFEQLQTKWKGIELLGVKFFPENALVNLAQRLPNLDEFDLDQLKKISLSVGPVELLGQDMYFSSSSFKFCVSLDLDVRGWGRSDYGNLADLLEECTRLEELKVRRFSLPREVLDFCFFFTILIASNVKYLLFSGDDFLTGWEYKESCTWSQDYAAEVDSVLFQVHGGFRPNFTVDNLKLCFEPCRIVRRDHVAEFIFTIFVKYFRSVHHLFLERGNVNFVLQNQRHLRTLKIHSLSQWPVDIDLPLKMPIGIFTIFLKHIEIPTTEFFRILSNNTLPNLEFCFLEIIVDKERALSLRKMWYRDMPIEVEEFEKLSHLFATNVPKLKRITVWFWGLVNIEAMVTFMKSCLHFRQLRFMAVDVNSDPNPYMAYVPIIFEKDDLKNSMFQYLTQMNSSFRAAVISATSRFCFHYFFNIVTKEFEFSETSNEDVGYEYPNSLYVFRNYRIDDFRCQNFLN